MDLYIGHFPCGFWLVFFFIPGPRGCTFNSGFPSGRLKKSKHLFHSLFYSAYLLFTWDEINSSPSLRGREDWIAVFNSILDTIKEETIHILQVSVLRLPVAFN